MRIRVLGAVSLGATLVLGIGLPSAQASERAVVERVVAGDRLEINLHGERQIAQLVGIDTPRPRVECGGKAARKVLRHYAEPGVKVMLDRDGDQPDTDSRGRLLRYVSVSGRDLGQAQAFRGWAEVSDEPIERARAYARAARSARERRAGVWNYCDGEFHQPI